MTFFQRKQATHLMDYIPLNDQEKNIYNGYGWSLVQVKEDQIIDIFYILNDLDDGTLDEIINQALSVCQKYIHESAYPVYFGMMSCYDFCDPRLVSHGQASNLAYMAKTLSDKIQDEFS